MVTALRLTRTRLGEVSAVARCPVVRAGAAGVVCVCPSERSWAGLLASSSLSKQALVALLSRCIAHELVSVLVTACGLSRTASSTPTSEATSMQRSDPCRHRSGAVRSATSTSTSRGSGRLLGRAIGRLTPARLVRTEASSNGPDAVGEPLSGTPPGTRPCGTSFGTSEALRSPPLPAALTSKGHTSVVPQAASSRPFVGDPCCSRNG